MANVKISELKPPDISLAVILVKLRRAFCVDTLMFELDREVYCMKKVLSVSIKTIIFFVGWAICVSVIPIPDTASAVIWRFWAELILLLSVIAITLIFWLAPRASSSTGCSYIIDRRARPPQQADACTRRKALLLRTRPREAGSLRQQIGRAHV